MKIVVTCGPSFEPIDQVRRLTNFSTGELGVLLSEVLTAAGHEVICLKGVGATAENALEPVHTEPFETNDDLQMHLEKIAHKETIGALFHVAALCDFKVAQARDGSGKTWESAKIPSRIDSLTLVLEPARKVISGLRALFPQARIVGWKYELVGSREDALQKGIAQIEANQIDACVVNGTAYSDGFGLCTRDGLKQHCADKPALCRFLVEWLRTESPLAKS